jgi:hypothetical protein
MTFRLRERRSALAVWSTRLALLSIPVLIIAAIGQRSALMDATETYAVIALGFSIAALAVIAAVAAFEGIWRDGRKGVGPAARGLIVGLAILSLPAIGAWEIINYPRLTEVSTDPEDPPAFIAAIADRGADARPLANPSEEEIELQREAYPEIVPRHYPVGTARVYDDARAIVDGHGWRVIGFHRPDEADATGRIEAVATTLIFGFRQDVVIEITPDGEGALVDMRSAARNGAHDLGANAARIRAFFADLDVSLQGITE